MVMNQDTPKPLDPDESTIYTPTTPPEAINNGIDSLGDIDSSTSSIPSEGLTFIIRSVSCGRVIMLLDGKVVLAHPNDHGAMLWECTESGGWLGFRNLVSGKFLGYDNNGKLYCWAESQDDWEYFNVRHTRKGGYILLMTQNRGVLNPCRDLWCVGIKREQGVESLGKIGKGVSGGIVWEFIEFKKG